MKFRKISFLSMLVLFCGLFISGLLKTADASEAKQPFRKVKNTWCCWNGQVVSESFDCLSGGGSCVDNTCILGNEVDMMPCL